MTLGFLLNSCEFSINTNQSKKIDLGEMPKVKSETFDNIYIADEKTCEKKNLPITRFAVEYPNGFEVVLPNNKSDHITISKKVDGIIVEEFSIGNSTITLSNKNSSLELLENIIADLKNQIPELQIINISKKKFNGEMTYLFEGKVDYSAYVEQGYNGIYKTMFLLPIPRKNENLNAVLISFIANEQSEIKEFSDFANKGMIGKVYNTFRYLE